MEIYGAVLDGVNGKLIVVDSDIISDRRGIKIIGARGIEVREAAEKVSRVLSSPQLDGINKNGLITIDLRPGDFKIRGETLALAMAIRAYVALIMNPVSEELPTPPRDGASDEEMQTYQQKCDEIRNAEKLRKKKLIHLEKDSNAYLLIGGITLDGRLYPPERGLMGLISAGKQNTKIIVPETCGGYAKIAQKMLIKQGKKVEIVLANTFQEAADIVDGTSKGKKPTKNHVATLSEFNPRSGSTPDFSDIVGQTKAKFALEIAAAGGHNILLWGPQGEAKSMLSKAVPDILPNLKWEEIAEVNKIYTAKGLLKPYEAIRERPFRRVGASATMAGLLGGGTDPEPGEISLAHTGVLMIDEFNLMHSSTMEELRVPLEEGFYDITRRVGTRRFPAQFCLIATMNPCKCSYYGEFWCSVCHRVVGDINSRCNEHPDAKTLHRCECNRANDIKRFQNFSGPILDRIDLRVQIFSVDPYLTEETETSADIQKRVNRAIDKQFQRYKDIEGLSRNAQINHTHIKRNILDASESAKIMARMIYRKHRLNMRSFVRLHAVARTIADLKGRNQILDDDVLRAHQIMGKRSYELFSLSQVESYVDTAPKEDTKRAKEALEELAKAVGNEMVLRKYTSARVAKEAGVPLNAVRSILAGTYSKITTDARKLFTWVQRKKKTSMER